VFFGGDIKSGVIFRPFWPRLPVPGPRPLHGIFDSSFYWELGKNLHFWAFDGLSGVSGY